jgi:DNA ligase (NAD+)
MDDLVRTNWMEVYQEKERVQKENQRRRRSGTATEEEPYKGIGKEIFESLNAFFSEPHNQDAIKRLQDAGIRVETKSDYTSISTGPLTGKAFVFSGKLQRMQRDEAQQKVRNLGGKVLSGVTRNVDYLVVGAEPSASKIKQAKVHGIEILDEDGFWERFGLHH